MKHYTGQTSFNTNTHSLELQLAVLRTSASNVIFPPFEAKHYQHQDELNLFLSVAKHLKYHSFAAEQQPLLSLPDKASQVSRTAFL